MQYPPRTITRANQAVRCAPFRIRLYTTLMKQSVALIDIAGIAGVRHQYTTRSLPELLVESELMWLIQVGLLRREVDGQGLTDSFRITPLGRQLVETWQNRGVKNLHPTWSDRIYNAMGRWVRLPI
jgi:hypothetical protein